MNLPVFCHSDSLVNHFVNTMGLDPNTKYEFKFTDTRGRSFKIKMEPGVALLAPWPDQRFIVEVSDLVVECEVSDWTISDSEFMERWWALDSLSGAYAPD